MSYPGGSWHVRACPRAPCDPASVCGTSQTHPSYLTSRDQGGCCRRVQSRNFGSYRTACSSFLHLLLSSIQNCWQKSSYSCQHQARNHADQSCLWLALPCFLHAYDLSRSCVFPLLADHPAAHSLSILLPCCGTGNWQKATCWA